MLLCVSQSVQPFRLTSAPAPKQRPKNVVESVQRLLDKPAWDETDVARLGRAVEWYWENARGNDTAEAVEQAGEAIKEWKRIQDAKPFPTAAFLARQSRCPREERIVRIYDRIKAIESARRAALKPLVKPRKTWKAQANENARVYGKDASLARLKRTEERLRAFPEAHMTIYNHCYRNRGR